MAKTGGGQTIIVAGGGGAGGRGSKGGGSGSGSGSSGGSKPSKGGKLKINDEMFNTALMALAGVGVVAYVYYSRPDLVTEFLGTITGNKTPAVPAQPTGTVQNDTMPQAPAQEMQYPQFPQQSTGMDQFQYPQQQSPNMQQYQPYQPTGYGGSNDISTSFNPMFAQNSNMPTQSFAARRISKLDYDSSDGMLRQV